MGAATRRSSSWTSRAFSATTWTPEGLTIGAPPPRVPLLVRVREELEKAAQDRKLKAVVLKINSPGGTVTASDILYHELDDFRRRTKLPMVAVMMDVAASGGYYIALAADTIVAHPTSVTGSIGVIMVTVNADGLLQKIGVTAAAIKSGPYKDMGSPLRALTPEERAIFQSVIDDLVRAVRGQGRRSGGRSRWRRPGSWATGGSTPPSRRWPTSSSTGSATSPTPWTSPARPPG